MRVFGFWYRKAMQGQELQSRVSRRSSRQLVLCFVVAGFASLGSPLRTCGQKASQVSSADIQVLGDNTKGPPALWFACDGATSDLERLLSEPSVIADLRQLKAGVALALPELTEGRARIALKLDGAGIPVTAWLALPGAEGYYMNAGNAREATARFREFERWSAAYGLRWASIGLDIEPNIQDFQALGKGRVWRTVFTIIGRYFSTARTERATKSYAELIREMHGNGYTVETYQFPFIADERDAHSTLLERIAGIVDVRADREALMLYTSFNPALDSALIWVYGPEAQAIIVGSTTGSQDDPRFHPLSWGEFSRDLRVASHFSRIIGVYSLEGCVQQGFLDRLTTMNWREPVLIPAEEVQKAERFRGRVQRAIWVASYLPYFAVVILVLAILLAAAAVRRRKRRIHTAQEQGRAGGSGER
jgi:hypothetical protein